MGRFKNESTDNPIVDWLLKNGYKYEHSESSIWQGYQKIYPVDNEFYYVWITFNFETKILYVYQEYNCGGCVDEHTMPIEDDWLLNLNTFIDKVDEKLEYWIG